MKKAFIHNDIGFALLFTPLLESGSSIHWRVSIVANSQKDWQKITVFKAKKRYSRKLLAETVLSHFKRFEGLKNEK